MKNKQCDWAVMVMTVMALVAGASTLTGCATIGWVPDFLGFDGDEGKTTELIALEGAAVIGVANYIAMAKRMPEEMSNADHLRMAVKSANDFVLSAYPGLGKDAEQLLEDYTATVSRGKWTPKVKLLYGYVYTLIDLLEPTPKLEPLSLAPL